MARSRSLADVKSKTTDLYADPHNPFLHLARGYLYVDLGFPDLAAADAYRALALLDSVVDPDGYDFHARRATASESVGGKSWQYDDDGFLPITLDEYNSTIGSAYALLVQCLVRCGCLRDAYEFAVRGISVIGDNIGERADCCDRTTADDSRDNENMRELKGSVKEIKRIYCSRRKHRSHKDAIANETIGTSGNSNGDVGDDDEIEIDASLLPAQGYGRRVLYPWNEHEPNRKASETMQLLNERIKDVAPKCEVRAVALPALHGTGASKTINQPAAAAAEEDPQDISIQLGLFAKEDIHPGEILLRETSLLTATNRLHDDVCEACNGPLPGLADPEPPVACENCEFAYFCSSKCHDQAQDTYHAAICGHEGLESIGKDIPDRRDKADYLYLLLLGRALAMSATQDIHPLDLPEVKYIWGDFHDFNFDDDGTQIDATSNGSANTTKTNIMPIDPSASLPFSFHLNILQPMRLLEEMGLDPFLSLPRYDTWVLNTLYAKFRGTASGRLSTWDGAPEVCAVHPLWCLANHSCDPNVRWEWGGEITFSVRGKGERAVWGKGVRGNNSNMNINNGKEDDGDVTKEKDTATVSSSAEYKIRKDEEILNHYCDIDLDVKERREWAQGALGGLCVCKRCVWESEGIS